MIDLVRKIGAFVLVCAGMVVLGVWASGLFGGGAGGVSAETQRAVVRAEAAEARADSIQRALSAVYGQFVEYRRRDSIERAELRARIRVDRDRARSAGAEAVRRIDSLEAILDTIRDRVSPPVTAIVDSAIVRLDSIRTSHRRTVSSLRTALSRADSARRSLRRSLDMAEATIDECREGVDACVASRDSLQVALESMRGDVDDAPGFWGRVGGTLPEVAAKAGALGLACAVPSGEDRLPACAGAAGVILVDVAVN